MKKLLLSFLISTGCAPDKPLTDDDRLDKACEELSLTLHYYPEHDYNSANVVEMMRAYVDGIERLRKIYGKQ